MGLALCGLAFAYHAIWIWQGFDITDEGHQLTNQWLIVNARDAYDFRAVWLTDLAGGLWLAALGDPGIVAARFAWVLLRTVSTVLTYWVLARYFSRRAAFWAAAFGCQCCVSRGTRIPTRTSTLKSRRANSENIHNDWRTNLN